MGTGLKGKGILIWARIATNDEPIRMFAKTKIELSNDKLPIMPKETNPTLVFLICSVLFNNDIYGNQLNEPIVQIIWAQTYFF